MIFFCFDRFMSSVESIRGLRRHLTSTKARMSSFGNKINFSKLCDNFDKMMYHDFKMLRNGNFPVFPLYIR